MFSFEDKELTSALDFYFEKMNDFGFDKIEATILLMNAGENTNSEKIMNVVDYLEPVECGGVVRTDVDKDTAIKEITKLLIEN